MKRTKISDADRHLQLRHLQDEFTALRKEHDALGDAYTDLSKRAVQYKVELEQAREEFARLKKVATRFVEDKERDALTISRLTGLLQYAVDNYNALANEQETRR